MKNKNKCKKCSCEDIIRVPGQIGIYGAGNNISVGLTYIKVTRYICSQCGFVEEWIDSKEDLLKVEKKYN